MKHACYLFTAVFIVLSFHSSVNGMPGQELGNAIEKQFFILNLTSNADNLTYQVPLKQQEEQGAGLLAPIANDRIINLDLDGGNPIYQVTVKLLSDDGTTLLESNTTDSRGNFCFANIAMGPYQLEVSKTGYVTSNQSICVAVTGQAEVDVELADD